MATKRSMRGFRFEGSLIGRLHVRKGGVSFFFQGLLAKVWLGLELWKLLMIHDFFNQRLSGSQNMGTQITTLWSAYAELKTNLFPHRIHGTDWYIYLHEWLDFLWDPLVGFHVAVYRLMDPSWATITSKVGG